MNLKKNAKRLIIGGVAVAAVVIGVVSLNANAALHVKSFTVTKSDFKKVTEFNSNVRSDFSRTYYSEINGKIGNILVKEGDSVKKGDLLISFDSEEIERQLLLMEFEAKTNQGNYDDALQANRKTAGLYSEATNNLTVLNQQIEDTQNALTKAQNKLLEYDYDDYAKAQEEVNRLTVLLADYKELKAEMTNQKASSYTTVMTKAGKEKIAAVKESNDYNYERTTTRLNAAKDGIRADFNGVVTSIETTAGASVGEGTMLITLESTDDVVVRSCVNKYDIDSVNEGQPATVKIRGKEYAGKVTRIEKMVDPSQGSGVGVEVALEAPDDNIILGLEVKSKIETANLKDVLQVPTVALDSDDDGDFVFVLNDCKAVKTYVELGEQNDDMARIVSGINAGDVVVWSENAAIKDGSEVNVD